MVARERDGRAKSVDYCIWMDVCGKEIKKTKTKTVKKFRECSISGDRLAKIT